MYTVIVFLPLLGSAIAGLFGRLIGDKASELVTTAFLFASAFLSCYAFYDVALAGHAAIVPISTWIASPHSLSSSILTIGPAGFKCRILPRIDCPTDARILRTISFRSVCFM